MGTRKSTFETHDLSPTRRMEGSAEPVYNGIERRMSFRRQNEDRRGEVRFELTNSDRRENPGRRKGDNRPVFW